MPDITFDHAATGYSLAHVRCLAYAADLAYKDEERRGDGLAWWGS
ncbi:hypothetical protein [Nonomuraea sp. KM90]